MQTLLQLVEKELESRQEVILERSARQEKIEWLIHNYCNISPGAKMSRAAWQRFCFKNLFHKITPPNLPFIIELNQTMQELGFNKGWSHTKIGIYKGLEWK